MTGQQSSPQPRPSRRALSELPGLPGIIVSGEWLQGELGSKDLVILHVGSEPDYEQGHLPGALLVKLADLSVTSETGLRLELPRPDQLTTTLGKLGITGQHRVVIYHGTESVQSATRVWFTFDYLGRGGQAALLDGGLALWKQEGRPLTTQVPALAPATFSVEPNANTVASMESMRTFRPGDGTLLVDARLPQFYSGEELGIASRPGHIPGAVSRPYPLFFDESGRWKNPEALRELLQADGRNPTLVVTYCHIGQQATVPYVAARLLGLDVKLFDGSFQAWSREESLPVARQP